MAVKGGDMRGGGVFFSVMHMIINTCPKLRDQVLPQDTEQNVAKGPPQS